MRRKTQRRLFAALLIAALLLGMLPAQAAEVTAPTGKVLISKTEYPLVKGVTETDVIMKNADSGTQIMGYMTTVAPSAKVTFKASYSGFYIPNSTPAQRTENIANMKWNAERTTDQAAAFENATGGDVIFATNGDYYNMQTLQPLGYLIMEGNVIQTGNGSAREPYFAVLKDGSYAIRDYGTDCSDVVEAISGPFYLVKNGVNLADSTNLDLFPTNSIGIKADGSVVTFLADGRQPPFSVGMTLSETADFLIAQGVVTAIYLDGGGSATYVSQREGTTENLVRNSPSDGPERTVASALLLVATQKSDSTFDHAALAPNNTVYTPGSTVQVTAAGVDEAGGPAPLPEGLTFTVPEQCGSIDATGLFTASADFTGEVTVTAMYGQAAVGSTVFTIADIDELYFDGESISLDFNAESDLGLNAKFAGREILYKDGDFVWELTSDTEGKTADDIGRFTGNSFLSGSAEGTMNGTAQVRYTKLDGTELTATIHIEVGKMPVVLHDFEANENGMLQCAHYHWGSNVYHYAGSPYGEGYEGEHPELNVITSGTYSEAPTYTNLHAPYQFTGNYDTGVPAAPIYNANGYSYYLWPNGTLTEYGCGDLKTVTQAQGGQVRFGESSLELDYDYASYDGSKNANYYIRNCGGEISIEGYPTQLGVWVYAPEGTANYALAMDIAVWNESSQSYKTSNRWLTTESGTLMGSEHGIEWSGWMYCYSNLEDLWPSITAEHPLKIRQGEGVIWLCYQPGKNLGGRFNGTLYFDNPRVVYGTNLDDLANPEITGVAINGTSLAADGSTVLKTASVEITADFRDTESQNRSGIDASKTVIRIDGNDIALDGSEQTATTRTTLGNGKHTVTVNVYDAFGNAATVTRAFTVDDAAAANPSVSVIGSDLIAMGSTYSLQVMAQGTIDSLEATLSELNSDFGEPVVTFAEGVTGEATYTETGFKKASLKLTASAAEGMTGELATISFHVPSSIDAEVDFFTYAAKNLSFTYADEQQGTDAQSLVKLTVVAYYSLQLAPMVEGGVFAVTVLDINGKPAADVEVFYNSATIGRTDATGCLVTDALSALPAGTVFVLTASNELGVSFETKGTVLSHAGGSDAKPSCIHLNAPDDLTTQQSITWFANSAFAAKKAYVRFMTEEDYVALGIDGLPDTDYRVAKGTGELIAFPTTKNAALINTVTLKKLTPDTTYYYWVGDGTDEGWSDMQHFSTLTAQEAAPLSFFILGDTQMSGDVTEDAEAIATLSTVLDAVGTYQPAFGLQTGDFVDNGGSYAHWQEILDVFAASPAAEIPMLHVLGNHEYFGSYSGEVANSVIAAAEPDYYSVEYGSVYVAVINLSADPEQAAEWLKRDAAFSTCEWKLLTLHQPPYYTNANGGNEQFHALIPAAADEADIDFVFSGHDHSFARTQPLTAGEPDEDGTVYYICGDMGEKSRDINYAAVNNPDFHFDAVTQEYNCIYMIATVEGLELTVKAYDLDGTLVDSYSLNKDPCKDGHTYVYDHETEQVLCSVCGESAPVDFTGTVENNDTGEEMLFQNGKYWPCKGEHTYVYDTRAKTLCCSACDEAAPADYTGFAKQVQSGKQMYFLAGTYETGWTTIGTDIYHFDEETGEMHKTTVSEDIPTTCSRWGHCIISCECGCEPYRIDYSMPAGHSFSEVIADDGTAYYCCDKCGEISLIDVPFIDVADDSWYAKDIEYVYQNGYFSGTTAIHFEPHGPMTRAMLASVLWRAAGEPDYQNVHECVFSDCKLNSWYVAAVNWMYKEKIITGYPDGTFGPEDNITREQMVLIIRNYMDYLGENTTTYFDLRDVYTDVDEAGLYALTALSWAAENGIITGKTATTLNPKDTCTRAEVAAVIHRLALKYELESPTIADEP